MQKDVVIGQGRAALRGILAVPEGAKGIVLFAHGSGSGRLSTRNQFVAKKMQEGKLATLLMDLLTEEEEAIDENTRQYRFDIDLLAERLILATDWLQTQDSLKDLPVLYFGASTGAAAALVAASFRGSSIQAVVSRGGRPDLADSALSTVVSPTLLIVGGNDFGVIELNMQAYKALSCKKKVEIVKGATHLFEEPGMLDEVARLASSWFLENIKK